MRSNPYETNSNDQYKTIEEHSERERNYPKIPEYRAEQYQPSPVSQQNYPPLQQQHYMGAQQPQQYNYSPNNQQVHYSPQIPQQNVIYAQQPQPVVVRNIVIVPGQAVGVTCPFCLYQGPVQTRNRYTGYTWIWCIFLLFFTVFLWIIPLFSTSCQDKEYSCRNCKRIIQMVPGKCC